MDTNVESENTEKEEEVNDGIPTYEELKQMCSYAGVSVETGDKDNTVLYGFYEILISTAPMGRGTTPQRQEWLSPNQDQK